MAPRTNRHQEIREAALALFSERGFYGTGMGDIARSLDMGASSLYNHWSSKQDLLADIMMTTMTRLIDQLDVVTQGCEPAEALQCAMRAHVVFHATHRDEVRVGNREISSLSEPTRSTLLGLRAQYADRWKTLIRAGVDAGAFEVDSVDLAAYALLEMGIGVHQWFRDGGAFTAEQVAEHYSAMALRQVGVAPQSL